MHHAVAGPSTSTPCLSRSQSGTRSANATPEPSYATFSPQQLHSELRSTANSSSRRQYSNSSKSKRNGKGVGLSRAVSDGSDVFGTQDRQQRRTRRWSVTTEQDMNYSVTGKRRRSSAARVANRSISQALLRAVVGKPVDSEDDDEADATTYFLTRPVSYTEAVAAYVPNRNRRISAILRPVPSRPSFSSEREASRRTLLNTTYGSIDSAIDDGEDVLPLEAVPYGVLKMEVIAKHMRSPFIPIYLITLFTSLSSTTTPAVEPFLLSTFGGHAYISSIAIITSIAYAACKPPMAKILDVFGRTEGLALSAILYGLGFMLVSSSRGILSFGIARVIASAGGQGLNLAQQVIMADVTSLSSRALALSTTFIPWLVTPWIGPYLGQWFKDHGEVGFRATYTTFGVLVPLSCVCLLYVLWDGYRRVLRLTSAGRTTLTALKDDGNIVEADASLQWQPQCVRTLAATALAELDVLGIVYLVVGCTLVLLPLSLAATSPRSWRDPIYPTLTLVGVAALGLLGYHEACVAAHPLIPTRLLKQKTVMAGCSLCAFHFFCQFAYESYFPSFLQVARGYSVRDASYISESYVFTATVAALICGVLVKVTHRYRTLMLFGIAVHAIGVIMMVRFRSLSNTTLELVMSQVIGGFGGGFTTLGAQLGVQAVVGHQDVAVVTAVFLTITQIGGAVGGAVSGVIWTTYLPQKLRLFLPEMSDRDIKRIFGSMAVALSYDRGTPERDAIDLAYFEVQRMLNFAALAGLIPALICGLLMADVSLGSRDETASTVLLDEVLDDISFTDESGSSPEVRTPLSRHKQSS